MSFGCEKKQALCSQNCPRLSPGTCPVSSRVRLSVPASVPKQSRADGSVIKAGKGGSEGRHRSKDSRRGKVCEGWWWLLGHPSGFQTSCRGDGGRREAGGLDLQQRPRADGMNHPSQEVHRTAVTWAKSLSDAAAAAAPGGARTGIFPRAAPWHG